MEDSFAKVMSLAAFIVLGHLLRRFNILKDQAFAAISALVMNVTLPCVILTNLNGVRIEGDMLCTNGCTVTGDSVSEDFPISPPPSVVVVPIHTSGGRISASAGAQFPVRAPERPGAGPSSTKDGRQSWKTASPR